MVLVYFNGRGKWFIGSHIERYDSRTAWNYGFKDPLTGINEITNEFFQHYSDVSEAYCHEYVGLFRLTPKDEVIYLESKSFLHIEVLLPCDHELSAFNISSNENNILKNSFDNCFFIIQKSIDLPSFNNRIPYKLFNKICTYEEYQRYSEKYEHSEDTAFLSTLQTSDTIINFNGVGQWIDRSVGEHIYPFYNENGSCFPSPPVGKISGFFALTIEDEIIYKTTNSYDHVSILLPCNHPESAFWYLVNNKICFYDHDFDFVVFKIYKTEYKNKITITNNVIKPLINEFEPVQKHANLKSHENSKKTESLRFFIADAERLAKNKSIESFNKEAIRCTKDQLLAQLKIFEQNHSKEKQVWNDLKSFKNATSFWNSPARKAICDVKPEKGKNILKEIYSDN